MTNDQGHDFSDKTVDVAEGRVNPGPPEWQPTDLPDSPPGGLPPETPNSEPPTRAPDTDDPEAKPAPPHDTPNPKAIPANEGGEQE